MAKALAQEPSPSVPAGAGLPLAHLSAASRYGLWLPALPGWLPTLAVTTPGVQRPRQRGLYVFRSRAGFAVRELDGSALVSPAACLGQLAEDLSVLDLVIAVDSALQLRLCTVAEVEGAVVGRQRGLPSLRRALSLADGRSESPWETALRVLFVTAGIDVEVQPEINGADGTLLARSDLRIRGTRRLPEYDGAAHRDQLRHRSDLAREKALAREGWQRFGYTAPEILGSPDRVLRDAEESLGWPHDPGRLSTWKAMVLDSSLTATGRARLADRLLRFTR